LKNDEKEFIFYNLTCSKDSRGRIIITSRNLKVGEVMMLNSRFSSIAVSELTPPNAKQLLRAKLPKEKRE
jgi:hypothetical protein